MTIRERISTFLRRIADYISPPKAVRPPPPSAIPEEPYIPEEEELRYLKVKYWIRPLGPHREDEYSDSSWVEIAYSGDRPDNEELLRIFNGNPDLNQDEALPYAAFAFAVKAIK